MQNPPGQNAHLERRELPEENPRPVGRSMLEHYNSRTPFPWLNLQPPAVWAGQSSPSNTAWAIICLTRWTRTHRPTVCVHWHKTPGLSSIASGARVSFQDKPTRQHRTQKGQAHTGGGFFHHTAWGGVTPHAAHPQGCLAVQETHPSEIKASEGAWGCARWWKEPLLNKRMPLQWSQCPQHEAGVAVIVQSAFYSLTFTEAVFLSEPLTKTSGLLLPCPQQDAIAFLLLESTFNHPARDQQV